MARLGLAGPSYVPYSETADSQRTVNLFPSLVQSGRGKSRVVLYGTPGLESHVVLSTANAVKSVFYDTFTKRTFVVKRTTTGAVRLSELTSSNGLANVETPRWVGGVPGANLLDAGGNLDPVAICSNGSQLFIVLPEANRTFLYTLATDTLTRIDDVANGSAVWVDYLDGYFIALGADGRHYYSRSLDGSQWDNSDVATAESSPDKTIMLKAHNDELWLFGPESVEVWYNSGNADNPFAPNRQATMEMGLQFRYSVMPLNGRLYWVGRNESGSGFVCEAHGYQPRIVSNFAVSTSLQGTVVTGAAPRAWVHQRVGQSFYVLTYPDDNLTWAYDPAMGRNDGWHERMHLNGEIEEAHLGLCCAHVGSEEGGTSRHLVGGRDSGKVYALKMSAYDDDGVAIRRIRRAQHLSNEMMQVTYHGLELDVEHGVGEVEYNLRFSNDGGQTFGNPMAVTKLADQIHNPEWRTLGMGRDRVFEVFSDSAVKHAWIEAFIRATTGAH